MPNACSVVIRLTSVFPNELYFLMSSLIAEPVFQAYYALGCDSRAIGDFNAATTRPHETPSQPTLSLFCCIVPDRADCYRCIDTAAAGSVRGRCAARGGARAADCRCIFRR